MGKFWDDQPTAVCCDTDKGPSEILRPAMEDISSEPTDLPSGLVWDSISKENHEFTTAIKQFLDGHYVCDDDTKFRLCYSTDFIRDFLSQGKYSLNAIILSSGGDIVGFIAAAFRKVCIAKKQVDTVEVNLLCVHADYRDQRLAEHLIREITRKTHLQGIFTAIHTSGKSLPPKAFCASRYYHKFLDVKKLNDVGYTNFPDADLSSAIRHHQHKKQKKRMNPLETYILRPFKEGDIPLVQELFQREKYDHALSEIVDEEKLKQMSAATYLDNYVVEKVSIIGKKRQVVGFVSVYNMDLLVIGSKDCVKTSYINVYCGDILAIINDLFTLLQNQGRAVINCLDIGKNKTIARIFNMLPGTGYLYYYMYNYRMPPLPTEEVSYMVL